ncbi:MAG: DNA-directed DNA polymerase II small subunit [Candidatus Micrarchaeota archaeon]|nr:DNA-directed DNA polymerase II small subunit [Candidatus Micrarchaeota archaeon]
MAGENTEDPIKYLVKSLSKFGVLVAADVNPGVLEGFKIDDIASRIIERRVSDPELKIVNDSVIKGIVSDMLLEKAPRPIEIVPKPDFRASAADVEANYSISNHEMEYSNGSIDGFVSHFRSRMQKLRDIIEQHRGTLSGMMSNLEGLKSYSSGREVAVIGIILNKITTKNGNIMVVIDDETSEAKIMFMNGTSQQAKLLFEKARHLVNDEVVAIKGKISGPFVIATELVWPDVPIHERKRVDDDVAIAFISDIQIGSKLFMEKNFANFIKWINGNYEDKRDVAGKVKYLVVGGDVVDGIGVYPNQDRDLAILDIYAQYKLFFNFMSMIPEHIHVFVIPGNHDAVQRAEPQPALNSELVGDFKSDTVHILPNPSFLTLHGIDVLAYHGTSLDSIIRSIPGTSYANPEKAMIEILKRRHLSPIWGGNIIVPSRDDNLVIDKVPDILLMGHVHKNCISNYHGVDIINSGTWQATTEYQLVQGHIPSPCVVPVYEAKSNSFITVNFNK